jgi:hypothetical protein
MLTSPHAKRVKTVAMAVALMSWLLPVAIVLMAVPLTRPVAIAGLAVCATALLISLLLAWTLYCPWCCERLFFVASMVNSPTWTQLRNQFIPYDIVVNGRFTCPHCHSRFRLGGE